MNQKRAIIEQFIEKDLLDVVAKELTTGALAQEAGLAQQLVDVTAQIKENIGDEALDAEGNLAAEYHGSKLGKQYLALRQRAAGAKSNPERESEIFNHLYTFFSRYYDDGDFMSLRRYSKREKYAIPYNGEEVHLHWANSDQYYIKTGENFTDYSYQHDGWMVHLKLRNADVEQNNVKGAKRFFIPRSNELVFDYAARTVTLPFEFRPLTADEEIRYGKGGKDENGAPGNVNGKEKGRKKKGQDSILADALAILTKAVMKHPRAQAALMSEKRKDADGSPVSLIEHHLRTYTRANTSDFFIHKDLRGFLERELDFYLKNEVFNLDELEAAGQTRAEGWFQLVCTIKSIGRRIITFVAQIENFQKRLFEKKKFVTEVHYCATLDRVPEQLYPKIAKNKAQIDEWKRLFHICEIEADLVTAGFKEPLSLGFLKSHPYLVLDTRFYSQSFVDNLLSSKEFVSDSGSIDAAANGVIFQGDNLHVLSLIRSRYRHQLKCVYIDPPYNTGTDGFPYKDTYQHSSWLAMMHDRVRAAIQLLSSDSLFYVSIDRDEHWNLEPLLFHIFGEANFVEDIVWQKA